MTAQASCQIVTAFDIYKWSNIKPKLFSNLSDSISINAAICLGSCNHYDYPILKKINNIEGVTFYYKNIHKVLTWWFINKTYIDI